MKDYIKSLASLVLSVISSWAVYYILLFLDIVSYYEFSAEVENLQTYCVIVILFLLFNFLYGCIFNYSIIKNAVLQGSYLLLSGMLMFIFEGNKIVDLFSFFNLALLVLYEIIKGSNIIIKAVVFIACVSLPILFSSMGVLLSRKKKKSQLTK